MIELGLLQNVYLDQTERKYSAQQKILETFTLLGKKKKKKVVRGIKIQLCNCCCLLSCPFTHRRHFLEGKYRKLQTASSTGRFQARQQQQGPSSPFILLFLLLFLVEKKKENFFSSFSFFFPFTVPEATCQERLIRQSESNPVKRMRPTCLKYYLVGPL